MPCNQCSAQSKAVDHHHIAMIISGIMQRIPTICLQIRACFCTASLELIERSASHISTTQQQSSWCYEDHQISFYSAVGTSSIILWFPAAN